MKPYSPPRVTTNRGRPCRRLRIGRRGTVKLAALAVRPDDGILGVARAEEDAVVDPLGLDELELPPEVRADEGEHQPPIGAVVLQHSFRQQRAIRGSAPDHPVDPGRRRPRTRRAGSSAGCASRRAS